MSDYYGPSGGEQSALSQQPQQQQQQHHHRGGGGHSKSVLSAPSVTTGIDHGKIFVGGLSWQTTEESLRFHFEQYGPVVSVEVMKDRNTGEPRGFGFVVFEDPTTVDLVMDEPTHEINHKIVDVKRAQARGVAPPSIHRGGEGGGPEDPKATSTPRGSSGGAGFNNDNGGGGGDDEDEQLSPEQLHLKVFVGGIPPNLDRDGLREAFEQFGPVQDAIVMIDQATNRSRCFGFVTFEPNSNGAQNAIASQPIVIQGKNVEVKLAMPKAEQRRAPPAAGPKHVGLRAGISSSSSGQYAGLAVAYGRSGWKAGYGTYAFGRAGWNVQGWEDFNTNLPERAGFSFEMLENPPVTTIDSAPPSNKKARH
jgi:RNA recognition motif-containing protein